MPNTPTGTILAAGLMLVLVGITRSLAHMPLLGGACAIVGLALVGKFFWMRKNRSNV